MVVPPLPVPFEHLGNRPFSFYPPIVNIESNEWLFRRATWSEMLVVNTRSNMEVWIPRRFVGEISRIEDPVLIVGLVKELEYRVGAVWPYQRRVIEMPVAVGETPRTPPAANTGPAPVVNIRLESNTDSRITRLVVGALTAGILGCLLLVNVYRAGQLRPRISHHVRDQSFLNLNAGDDYYTVFRKLGSPTRDRWRSEAGDIQFRALSYPQSGFTVILMGPERQQARYIGSLDENWSPVHYVPLRHGGTTAAMLGALPRF